ncbi:hypothetical protein [Streptomyces sp. NPDC017556]|uniref:hypothetical protein n=1 Tax=Streptomyces sp. NPDC017556 TaxID=3365002 RepID=UPI0037B4FF6E
MALSASHPRRWIPLSASWEGEHALDIRLVRRDTEHEIIGVGGVDLTREERTALLQRLAYWLIRGGPVEARQDEAVSPVADWTRARSQVRGAPDQVFAHLLDRSDLLREPAQGSVGFARRTFRTTRARRRGGGPRLRLASWSATPTRTGGRRGADGGGARPAGRAGPRC